MKDPLVLLPGMMCDARLFMPQILDLGQDHSLHLAPICGFESIEAIAKSVLARAPERFALAGLSMGGIVAMEMMALAPRRISKLVLMDTNCQAELSSVAAAREPQIVGARAGRLQEIMRDEMKPNYLAPGPQRLGVLQTVMEMAMDMGPEVFIRQSRALQRRRDQQSTLRRSKTPTLILCGEHDALCPVRRHEFMADLMPNAVLKVIAGAGHLPTLEQPEVVNGLLRQFLADPVVAPA